jgi:MoaE-MoaD fusion protein
MVLSRHYDRSTMRVSVRLFAGLRERAGTDRLDVELPDGARVSDVLEAMAATPVGALRPRECVVAVNREYAEAHEPVRAGD